MLETSASTQSIVLPGESDILEERNLEGLEQSSYEGVSATKKVCSAVSWESGVPSGMRLIASAPCLSPVLYILHPSGFSVLEFCSCP